MMMRWGTLREYTKRTCSTIQQTSIYNINTISVLKTKINFHSKLQINFSEFKTHEYMK